MCLSFLFGIFLSFLILSDGFFPFLLGQKQSVPVLVRIGGPFADKGGVIPFIQSEELPQSLAELFVKPVYNILLDLYIVRMAQTARVHRPGFYPC